jgi:hypothetical protein
MGSGGFICDVDRSRNSSHEFSSGFITFVGDGCNMTSLDWPWIQSSNLPALPTKAVDGSNESHRLLLVGWWDRFKLWDRTMDKLRFCITAIASVTLNASGHMHGFCMYYCPHLVTRIVAAHSYLSWWWYQWVVNASI